MSRSIEGDNYVKQAEKCLKTSLLKWSVDNDGAIENYIKAAESYKKELNYENAIKFFLKASEMQSNNNSLFYAAKSMEEAAIVYKEQKKFNEMTNLILQAGQTFRINGSADSASQLMVRMAKSIEDDSPGHAAKLYSFASQASEDKDNLREAGEFAGLAAKLFVRSKDYEAAQASLHNKLKLFSEAGDFHAAGKAVVCLVLIHLHNNDFVGAAKVYAGCVESHSFSSTQDASPISQLLSAIDRCEYDQARTILKTHTFLYLENDFVKMARDIKFPESCPRKVTDGGDGGDDSVRYDLDDDIN